MESCFLESCLKRPSRGMRMTGAAKKAAAGKAYIKKVMSNRRSQSPDNDDWVASSDKPGALRAPHVGVRMDGREYSLYLSSSC